MFVSSSWSYICGEMRNYIMANKETLFGDPYLRYFFFTLPLNGTDNSTHTA